MIMVSKSIAIVLDKLLYEDAIPLISSLKFQQKSRVEVSRSSLKLRDCLSAKTKKNGKW